MRLRGRKIKIKKHTQPDFYRVDALVGHHAELRVQDPARQTGMQGARLHPQRAGLPAVELRHPAAKRTRRTHPPTRPPMRRARGQPPFLHASSGHQTAQGQPPHQAIRSGVQQARGGPGHLSVVSLRLHIQFGPRRLGHARCRRTLGVVGRVKDVHVHEEKQTKGRVTARVTSHVPACKPRFL